MNTGFEGLSEESSEEPHSKGLTQTAADFKLVAGSRATSNLPNTCHRHQIDHHLEESTLIDAILAILTNLLLLSPSLTKYFLLAPTKYTVAVPTPLVYHSQLITGIRPLFDVTNAVFAALLRIKNLNSKLDPCNSQQQTTIPNTPTTNQHHHHYRSLILCELILLSSGLSLLRNPIKTRALQRILSDNVNSDYNYNCDFDFDNCNSKSLSSQSLVQYRQCALHRPTLRPLLCCY